jgi:SAM-dependent methyltransferase
MLGKDTLEYLLGHYQFDTVLDLGCGQGEQSEIFRVADKDVTALSLEKEYERAVVGDYNTTHFADKFDCIWCCHVLEHQDNVGLFLEKLFDDTADGGVLAITAPPFRTDLRYDLRDDHVSVWTRGLLLYNLVRAGWDCADAHVQKYGYNISVIVKKNPTQLNTQCLKDAIEHFPKGYDFL